MQKQILIKLFCDELSIRSFFVLYRIKYKSTSKYDLMMRTNRKPIFLIVSAIVFLYFCIILFLLNPIHESGNVYYGNNYIGPLGLRLVPSVNWCKELHWRSPPLPYAVALVSYPGSGNTWLRYLLQQVTGVLTGSIYMDFGLKVHGFPAENITDGSVLVVKTHEAPPLEPDKFKSAVLLIRNPRDAILVPAILVGLYDAIVCIDLSRIIHLEPNARLLFRTLHEADFNRLHKGHIGTAPKSAFKKRSRERKRTDWSAYVAIQLKTWESLHDLWLTKFPGTAYIVFYETLVKDTKNTLQGVLNFLNYTFTENDMDCALSQKEGIYRRIKKLQDFDPFTQDMYRQIEIVKTRVINNIRKYRKTHNETNILELL